jgi:hypothetical protein
MISCAAPACLLRYCHLTKMSSSTSSSSSSLSSSSMFSLKTSFSSFASLESSDSSTSASYSSSTTSCLMKDYSTNSEDSISSFCCKKLASLSSTIELSDSYSMTSFNKAGCFYSSTGFGFSSSLALNLRAALTFCFSPSMKVKIDARHSSNYATRNPYNCSFSS